MHARAPFVVGRDGALGHWTGSGWATQSVGAPNSARDFHAVWGLSDDDAWAVGDEGLVAHWDGVNWVESPQPTRANLTGVWGADGHYYAVGDQGTFIELTASELLSNAPSTHLLNAVFGSAPDDVWAVGQDIVHWNGTSWSQVPAPGAVDLKGVWGSSPNDAWAVGSRGAFLHFDGMAWNFAPSPTTEDITGIWGSGANDIWAVGAGGSVLHCDGRNWSAFPAENFGPLGAIHGNSSIDVVAAGQSARVHFDGKSWTRLPDHLLERPAYVTAFGDGTNVFLGGMVTWFTSMGGGDNPELGRWDGSSMVDDLEPAWGGSAVVESGWASSPNDVWLALPTLTHWDGSAWSPSGTNADLGITALGGTSEDIWAATNTGQILRKKRN